jgi:hypothetical protein
LNARKSPKMFFATTSSPLYIEFLVTGSARKATLYMAVAVCAITMTSDTAQKTEVRRFERTQAPTCMGVPRISLPA